MLEEDSEKTRKLLESGSEIAASASGAAIGLLLGPGGAIAGAAFGPVLKRTFFKVGSEINDRMVGPRENIRMGAMASYAINRINELLEDGEELRGDNFFDEEADRSIAEEIFEGTLLKAKEAHEEAKVEYLGYLFANIAFDEGIGQHQSNQLISMAERLTYQQLCLISLMPDERKPANMKEDNFDGASQLTWRTLSLMTDIYELYRMSLVYCQNPGSKKPEALLGFAQIKPKYMKLRPFGKKLYNTMELSRIPESEIMRMAMQLSR